MRDQATSGGENLTSGLPFLDSAIATSFLQHREHICMWPQGRSAVVMGRSKHTMHSFSSCFFLRDASIIRLTLCAAANADDVSRVAEAATVSVAARFAAAMFPAIA